MSSKYDVISLVEGAEYGRNDEVVAYEFPRNEALDLVVKYKDQWKDKDDNYWLQRLMEEVGELSGVMAKNHDDTMEHELSQIASISLNWLRKLE